MDDNKVEEFNREEEESEQTTESAQITLVLHRVVSVLGFCS